MLKTSDSLAFLKSKYKKYGSFYLKPQNTRDEIIFYFHLIFGYQETCKTL